MAEDGEYAEVWRCSGQKGLCFASAPIAAARFFSKLLARQIAAVEHGLMPYEYAGGAGTDGLR